MTFMLGGWIGFLMGLGVAALLVVTPRADDKFQERTRRRQGENPHG